MSATPEQRSYWRKTVRLTGVLLAVWFLFTFVTSSLADQLNAVSFMGFPLGFYMSAQGSVIVYVIIVGAYAKYMNRLDRRYRRQPPASQRPEL